jgi:hypothetical protein
MMWQKINNREVYIVDRHNEVLPAWVKAYHQHQTPLTLITFDHHTDLHRAFLRYPYANNSSVTPAEDEMRKMSESRLSKVDICNESSINEAVHDLRHDEHIDCAIRLGIISHAYVLLSWQYQNSLDNDGATLFNYEPCFPGCMKDIHDENCNKNKADLVIDDSVLANRISIIEKSINIEDEHYILDIDLDVFNTSN